jgi:hypothetical protein
VSKLPVRLEPKSMEKNSLSFSTDYLSIDLLSLVPVDVFEPRAVT